MLAMMQAVNPMMRAAAAPLRFESTTCTKINAGTNR